MKQNRAATRYQAQPARLTPAATAVALMVLATAQAYAQEAAPAAKPAEAETVIVTGIRASLQQSLSVKRNAAAKVLEDSKSDVSWGNQIRSYVLDQSRIKDLRTGVEIGNTTAVLDGDLNPFLEESLKQGL